MKKFYLGALSCLMAMGANAQKVEEIGTMQGDGYYSLIAVPTEYAYDGKPSLYTFDNEDETATVFTIYNKAFAVDRTIKVTPPKNYKRVEEESREWNEETQSYTGEWIKKDLSEDYDLGGISAVWSMRSFLVGQLNDVDNHVYATQTLFNNDEKWEFLRPIYTETINDWSSREEDRDRDGEIDYKRTWYENKLTSYEVVSEDGSVLSTITFPEVYSSGYPIAIRWDGETFLAIPLEERTQTEDGYIYEDYIVVYGIDKNNSSVKKIAETPAMRAIPALAERNSTVNVTLDAETAKNGGELIITDCNGRTVGRSYVEAGQTSVPVTTDRMGSGVYNITLTEKGQKVENARIIVK